MPSPTPKKIKTSSKAAQAIDVSAASPKLAGKPAAVPTTAKPRSPYPAPTLTISSKNYSSWSLRGWLLARFVGLEFTEQIVSPDDADARRELLLLAPSIRVPCLTHEGAKVWNTLAIAQYLNDIKPEAGLMPDDRLARAHCRSVSGEMNSGFANLRASLPMNLKGLIERRYPGHKIWGGAVPDIERIIEIWSECLTTYGGPFLFGAQRGMADAMYAPVVTRFLTYDVKLNDVCNRYCQTIMAMPEMLEWMTAAQLEPDEIEQLDMDF